MWGGLIIIFTVGVYCGGGSIHNAVPVPFSFNGQGGAMWQNILISSAWYLLAITIAVTVHTLIYTILVAKSSGKNIKDIFGIKSKNEQTSTVPDTSNNNVNNSNYFNLVINENWYYRIKVKHQRMVDSW
jgi:hypothetical protein